MSARRDRARRRAALAILAAAFLFARLVRFGHGDAGSVAVGVGLLLLAWLVAPHTRLRPYGRALGRKIGVR